MDSKDDDAWVLIDSKTEPTTIHKDPTPPSKSHLIKVVKIMDKLRSTSRSKTNANQV